jgi:hypothetical protein
MAHGNSEDQLHHVASCLCLELHVPVACDSARLPAARERVKAQPSASENVTVERTERSSGWRDETLKRNRLDRLGDESRERGR